MPLVLSADANPGTAEWATTAGSIFATGFATVAANPVVIALGAGWDTGDISLATIQTDDTGATLGTIIGASISGGNLSITFANAVTTGDGVVGYAVIKPG